MAKDHDSLLPKPPSHRQGESYVGSEDDALSDDPMMRMIIPVGRSVWAIVAGYLGLLSVLLIPAPFALATGIIAVVDLKKNPKKHGMGRAVFGIVMGVLGSVIGLILLVFAILHPQAFR